MFSAQARREASLCSWLEALKWKRPVVRVASWLRDVTWRHNFTFFRMEWSLGYKRDKIPGMKGWTSHFNSKTGKRTVSYSSKPGAVRTTYNSDGQIRQTWVDGGGFRKTRILRTAQSSRSNRKINSGRKGGLLGALISLILVIIFGG